MNKYLIKLADHLDKKGLHKEADYVDWIMKLAEERSKHEATENKKIGAKVMAHSQDIIGIKPMYDGVEFEKVGLMETSKLNRYYYSFKKKLDRDTFDELLNNIGFMVPGASRYSYTVVNLNDGETYIIVYQGKLSQHKGLMDQLESL